MNDLFIGSGGITGFKYIGALEYLHQNKMLDLKNFYGCSIGSLIGILYISGYEPKDIIELFIDLNIKDLVLFNMDNINKNYLIDNILLESLINPLWKKHEKNITLGEFNIKTGVNINIICTDITNNTSVNFNNIIHPDIKLKDALKASMTIPFIFEPVEINGIKYVDGACKNIYGYIPNDYYILGFIIISKYKHETYFEKIIKTMQSNKKPRGYCIIECESLQNKMRNMKDITKKDVYLYYKTGIEDARNQIC